MMKRTWFLLFLLFLQATLAASTVTAEDAYQLLRSDPAGFERVVPGKTLAFPLDHLPHKDFRIEWWYVTANLMDAEGQSYGVHWTLFRSSMNALQDPDNWASNQVWMAHAALSTPDGHVFEERFARGGIDQANVTLAENNRFKAFMDDWSLTGETRHLLPATLLFTVGGYSVKLSLEANTPWVLQGNEGYSVKSAQGQASYYYSQPHIAVRGQISRAEQTAIAIEGKGWLDREWSSQPLAKNQPGWDWFSLHLDDGHALMVYRLRQSDGNHWISGSLVTPQGEATTLRKEDVMITPLETKSVAANDGTSRDLPLTWRIELPGRAMAWTVVPQSANQWLNTAFPYWEGPVDVKGSTGGVGFMELTGY
jgi:predicted secreted hydrolase